MDSQAFFVMISKKSQAVGLYPAMVVSLNTGPYFSEVHILPERQRHITVIFGGGIKMIKRLRNDKGPTVT